jgi:hypothetical protein
MESFLMIDGREYRKDPSGVFCVSMSDLGRLQIGEIPPHSSVHLTDLPQHADYGFSISITNGGEAGDSAYPSISGHIEVLSRSDPQLSMNRLRRVFLPFVERGDLPEPLTMPVKIEGSTGLGASFPIDCAAGRPP